MTMQTQKSAAATQGNKALAEPINLQKRIGSTMYTVSVRFSNTSKETAEDKILRLIKWEVREIA